MNVLLRKIFAIASVALVAAVLVIGTPGASAAQEDQDAAMAYNEWFAANSAKDTAKAIAAAEAYLEKFPTGQYADFLKKWLGGAEAEALNDAIKAGQIDQMIEIGDKILAKDPENLNVLYALANQLRFKELLSTPRSYAHAAKANEYASKAIALIDSGKTLAGVDTFDKDGTLAWLYQIEALIADHEGNEAKAIELYDKSTSLSPADPQIAGRNLLQVLATRQSNYSDAANAYNALPEEARGAAEPTDEVKAARDKVDTTADALIDAAARFVAFADAQGLPQGTRDKVYGILESVYKTRYPDEADPTAALQALIDSKK